MAKEGGYISQINKLVQLPVVDDGEFNTDVASRKLLGLKVEFQYVLRLEHADVEELVKLKNKILAQLFEAALYLPTINSQDEIIQELYKEQVKTCKAMFEAILKLPEGSKDQYEILKEMWTAMPNGSGDEILKKLVSQEDYKKIKRIVVGV